MFKRTPLLILFPIVLAVAPTHAQTQTPEKMVVAFPQDANAVASEDLSKRLSGHILKFVGGGNEFRADVRGNGYAFITGGTGFRDSGKWRIEGSAVCWEWRGIGPSCNEIRESSGNFWIKLRTGEVTKATIE